MSMEPTLRAALEEAKEQRRIAAGLPPSRRPQPVAAVDDQPVKLFVDDDAEAELARLVVDLRNPDSLFVAGASDGAQDEPGRPDLRPVAGGRSSTGAPRPAGQQQPRTAPEPASRRAAPEITAAEATVAPGDQRSHPGPRQVKTDRAPAPRPAPASNARSKEGHPVSDEHPSPPPASPSVPSRAGKVRAARPDAPATTPTPPVVEAPAAAQPIDPKAAKARLAAEHTCPLCSSEVRVEVFDLVSGLAHLRCMICDHVFEAQIPTAG